MTQFYILSLRTDLLSLLCLMKLAFRRQNVLQHMAEGN